MSWFCFSLFVCFTLGPLASAISSTIYSWLPQTLKSLCPYDTLRVLRTFRRYTQLLDKLQHEGLELFEAHGTVLTSNHTVLDTRPSKAVWRISGHLGLMNFSQFLCILEKFLHCLLPQLVRQTFQHMEIQMVSKEKDLTQWTKISFQLLTEFIMFPSACSVCHCLTLIQEQDISSLLNNKKQVNNNNEYK